MSSNPLALMTKPMAISSSPIRLLLPALLIALVHEAQAAQLTINGPSGSGEFGRQVTTLPNGNFVVTDPGFDAPGSITDAGAVYLYRPDGTLISTLRGGTSNNRVGSEGIVVLTNGNFVIRSPDWDNGGTNNVGAATFASGTSGIEGVVSAANSLVGSRAGDRVSLTGVTALNNGNYVVVSAAWDDGGITSAGAATFGSGTIGVAGVVSSTNSLVGSSINDQVGFSGVTALSNGNYVVKSPAWNNGGLGFAGAVTLGSGTEGISGAVSPANSLVGATALDQVGSGGVLTLANSNYLVRSPNWDNGIVNLGAVTFASGTTGITGLISSTNSLVGTTTNDQVGSTGVTVLGNGNYVVASANWNNGAIADAGAATFGSGSSGVVGAVSPANSLVGGAANNQVGSAGVTALSDDDYVVLSPAWDNGVIADVGAATFGSGTNGVIGEVSLKNSLVGSTAGDGVGSAGVTALSDGNYVVRSPAWNDGAIADVGAATFGSGTNGVTGAVSPANSLVGSATGDGVGGTGVTALTNGNYVVQSAVWDNGAIEDVGAVTFGSGVVGVIGAVSPTNSLVGSTEGDRVGSSGVTALANGNYVVRSGDWDRGAIVDAGAATFGSGTSGITGAVSFSNSLVGSRMEDGVSTTGVTALQGGNYLVGSASWDNGAIVDAGALTYSDGANGLTGAVLPANSLVGGAASDAVGVSGVTLLSTGHYVVYSTLWDNGAIANAGALTLGLSNGSVVGVITNTHSVLGTVANQSLSQVFSYDAARNQLEVGQPASNRVVLLRSGIATTITITGDTPDPSGTSQPATFTAAVSAASAPADGQVTFRASSGESCVDSTPAASSATSASFSCTISFAAAGTANVIAEYTGSIAHGYSGSAPESHTTFSDNVFANGFEGN